MESFVGEPIHSRFGEVFVNPGTGPVTDTTEKNARANLPQLILDAGLDVGRVQVTHIAEWDDDGRYGYELGFEGRTCEVLMPGLELERVRYMDRGTQDIWEFPRLYINGGSWVWMFAINLVRDSLLADVEAE